jgi:hypothetical protein
MKQSTAEIKTCPGAGAVMDHKEAGQPELSTAMIEAVLSLTLRSVSNDKRVRNLKPSVAIEWSPLAVLCSGVILLSFPPKSRDRLSNYTSTASYRVLSTALFQHCPIVRLCLVYEPFKDETCLILYKDSARTAQ